MLEEEQDIVCACVTNPQVLNWFHLKSISKNSKHSSSTLCYSNVGPRAFNSQIPKPKIQFENPKHKHPSPHEPIRRDQEPRLLRMGVRQSLQDRRRPAPRRHRRRPILPPQRRRHRRAPLLREAGPGPREDRVPARRLELHNPQSRQDLEVREFPVGTVDRGVCVRLPVRFAP